MRGRTYDEPACSGGWCSHSSAPDYRTGAEKCETAPVERRRTQEYGARRFLLPRTKGACAVAELWRLSDGRRQTDTCRAGRCLPEFHGNSAEISGIADHRKQTEHWSISFNARGIWFWARWRQVRGHERSQ